MKWDHSIPGPNLILTFKKELKPKKAEYTDQYHNIWEVRSVNNTYRCKFVRLVTKEELDVILNGNK